MIKKLVLLALLLPTCIFADSAREKGIKLTKQYWKEFKENDVSYMRKTLTSGFQGLRSFGATNKQQEIEIVKTTNIESYSLSHFIVTISKNILIVTYSANSTAIINGQRISGTAPRMNIWQKQGHHWKLAAFSSLAVPVPG